MAVSPYYNLIQRYFPPEEWQRADCISVAECSPELRGYPGVCTRSAGVLRCGVSLPYVNATAYGLFGLLDACWDPAINPDSPFSPEYWARRMEPEINTWMASVIWSRSGWRAWTTCATCQVCDFRGGAIPYPRGPAEEMPPYIAQSRLSAGEIVADLLFGVGAVVYVCEARKRRGL